MIQSSIGWKGICFSIGMLLFSTICMQAQTPESLRWPNFRREIGVDFNYFIEGRQGINLVFKHQIGVVKQGEKWQKTWALHVIPGFYNDKFIVEDGFLLKDTLRSRSYSYDKKAILVKIGGECQFRRKKSRIWLGANVGFIHKVTKSDGVQKSLLNGILINAEKSKFEDRSNTKVVSAMVGYQYFIFSKLSIGIELSLAYGTENSKTKYLPEGKEPHYDTHFIFVGEDGKFPSLLYLSFHF